MSKKYYLGVDRVYPIYDDYMDSVNRLEGIRVGIDSVDQYFPCTKYELFVPDECYKQAHDEAWKFVRDCLGMSTEGLVDCFGYLHIRPVVENLTYEEAKSKYDAWVKKNTVKEMTVEEVSEALGYNVKIVSKHKAGE